MDQGVPMIQFAWPWLFTLLPLPFLVPFILPCAKQNQALLQVPFFQQLNQFSINQKRYKRQYKNQLSAYFIWGLLIIAAANPVWIGPSTYQPIAGRNILLAVDISGSMKEKDMHLNNTPVTRLTIVKKAASYFIKERKHDRIGLILFGSNTYLRTPLTFDHTTVLSMLNNAITGLAGPKTAIGDAIGLSIKTLMKYPKNSRVLILLTDGTSNSGALSPTLAAKLAHSEKIKIYTIGLGASEISVKTPFGTRYLNPSHNLDTATLKAIANITKGQFFRAQDLNSLEQIYHAIDNLEPSKSISHNLRPEHPLYQWPLATALLLSLVTSLRFILLNLRSTQKLNKLKKFKE
ncbi:VWA domain-containing protein [Piscirickettsia salmonis]|uniref:VWA domain-containing protein n=1 Tax=Piscirickettsia salmonis TaxID=1238 RepID=UPI0009ED15EA